MMVSAAFYTNWEKTHFNMSWKYELLKMCSYSSCQEFGCVFQNCLNHQCHSAATMQKTFPIERPCFCMIFFSFLFFKSQQKVLQVLILTWLNCQWLPKWYIWPFEDSQRQIYQVHVFGPSIYLSLPQRLSLFLLCHLTSFFASILINAVTRGRHLTINVQQLWVVISFLHREPIQPFLWSGWLGFDW